MQLVQELDEVLGVFARAFLRAGLPAAVVVFGQTFQPALGLIQARSLEGGSVLSVFFSNLTLPTGAIL